ncbi:MAG: hypothetical protein KJN62_06235, partial [Deltaproteobacteria bacterium]|nr:hypothetical protein [Deltaproteobacteria bacterium]
AIQRAMLMTRNIKSQRLAAVSKTAIAANHEINSPLTTILLKLDMLIKDENMTPSATSGLTEIKNEAIKIKTVVKKMLEISDVVETHYVKNEKMLDIHNAPKQKQPDHIAKSADPEPTSHDDGSGFEDYLDNKPPAQTRQEGEAQAEVSYNSTPGFEDYLDQQQQEIQKNASNPGSPPQDNPGFEDYIEE